MKKVLSLAVVLAVFLSVAYATDTPKDKSTVATTSIVGTVVDKTTGESLAGVSVTIEGTELTAYTDFEGQFKFNDIIPGEYTIKSNMISYKSGITEIKADLTDHKALTVKLERSK
jgi:hypothetical protein